MKSPFPGRVWPAHFAESLPPVPVAPMEPGPDLRLELQPLIDEIYEPGRYHQLLDYGGRLTPPLSASDVKLVKRLLKQMHR